MPSDLETHLHPLAIVTISDHITRFRCQNQPERVVGAVLGLQSGNQVEFHNAFELLKTAGGELDPAFFVERLKQYQEVFEFEFLGWYTAGREPTAEDMQMHKQVRSLCHSEGLTETPFLLLMDPCPQRSKDLPIGVYDFVQTITAEGTQETFELLDYKTTMTEAERISVHHVSRSANTQNSSDFAQHLTALANSSEMLADRVRPLVEYLERTINGGKKSHSVLRELQSICQSINTRRPESADFYNEYNDAFLVAYLSMLTKTNSHLADVLDKQVYSNEKRAPHVSYQGTPPMAKTAMNELRAVRRCR